MHRQSLIARVITSLAGFALVVYGVVAALSPLPAGVPLLVLGLIMLAGANPAARPVIRRMRRRWRWFDRLVALVGQRGPESVREVVRETRPRGFEAEHGPEREKDGA